MIKLVDRVLENVTRKYVKFVLCSVLGFSVVMYGDSEEIEDSEISQQWSSLKLEAKSNDDLIKTKSYEIVSRIYDEVV